MVIKSRKNYYEILGVTPDSEFGEVKSAYRRLARKFHPDVNKAPDSIRRFKDITEAYDVLSDEVKRKQYDMVNGFFKSTKAEFASKNFKSGEKTATFEADNKSKKTENSSEPEVKPSKRTINDDVYRKRFFRESINSVLDEITKNHYSKKNSKTVKDGDDINAEISVTLEESLKGTERVLNIMHKELCPNCQGRKFINGSKCSYCDGTGEYTIHKKITVKIPQGVKNRAKLRLLNEGNPGFNGGKNGTLYITVKIEPQTNIQVDGSNLLCRIPITPFEAVLGGKINIPVFDGNISLTVPPMTHSGQKFRLANQGIKTNGKFGDMIVTVEIQIPKQLTSDEVKMYEKLKKMAQSNIRDCI